MEQGCHAASVAVVGSGGFIGRRLVATLQARGTTVQEYGRARPAVVDGRGRPALRDARTLFWCASSINPAIAAEHPELVVADRETFVEALHALDELDARCRVVLLSSGGTVYGRTPPPHAEDAEPRPDSAYGAAKLALEEALHRHRPGSVSVRVANAYGPGQPAASGQGVVSHWLRALRDDDDVVLFGDLATTRDFVFVDDVAEALSTLDAHPGPVPTTLNVGSGRPTSLAELVDVVHDVAAPARLRIERRPARSFDVEESWLDVRRAEHLLGWRARTDLRTGVARAWAAMGGTVDDRQRRATIT